MVESESVLLVLNSPLLHYCCCLDRCSSGKVGERTTRQEQRESEAQTKSSGGGVLSGEEAQYKAKTIFQVVRRLIFI